MKRILFALFAVLFSLSAFAARDIKDGNAYVKPSGEDKFLFDGNPLGKNMLMSSLQELKDAGKVTGVVLRNADKANGEQRRLLKVIADYLKINAFVEDGKELKPLGE
ncbi:hypothetical protein [Tahibacter soli]|jgi:hypothetical protein|uniref:Uncharacterized protein n=1 Tax=Tahibacter soli TaxID=2983605 RepID=A0A9X3YN27_9GAMM|nr:hypothetical protein [Tahibacter soli]MDC8015309.1 hypothetical protein [Tahibacter soli]